MLTPTTLPITLAGIPIFFAWTGSDGTPLCVAENDYSSYVGSLQPILPLIPGPTVGEVMPIFRSHFVRDLKHVLKNTR